MLPEKWIDKIFSYMSAMYGKKFTDMWHGIDIVEVKFLWATRLSRFEKNPEAIKYALEALDTKKYPPTLPEFIELANDYVQLYGYKTQNMQIPAPIPELTEEEKEINRVRGMERLENFKKLLHGVLNK